MVKYVIKKRQTKLPVKKQNGGYCKKVFVDYPKNGGGCGCNYKFLLKGGNCGCNVNMY